jgi:hypothetical protein
VPAAGAVASCPGTGGTQLTPILSLDALGASLAAAYDGLIAEEVPESAWIVGGINRHPGRWFPKLEAEPQVFFRERLF